MAAQDSRGSRVDGSAVGASSCSEASDVNMGIQGSDRMGTEARTTTVPDTVIAGGGPAGLTAAYELTKHGRACVVLEAETIGFLTADPVGQPVPIAHR